MPGVEGQHGVDVIARRLDPSGAVLWSVALPYIGDGVHPFALGDTLVLIVDDSRVFGLYRIGRDGSVSDALPFGSATYTEGLMAGRLPAMIVSSGGYAIGTQDAVVRFDDTGQLVWQRAIAWPGPIVEAPSGSLFASDRARRRRRAACRQQRLAGDRRRHGSPLASAGRQDRAHVDQRESNHRER